MADPRSTNTHSMGAADPIPRASVARFLFMTIDTIDTLNHLSMPMFVNGCLFIPSESLPLLKQYIFLTVKISASNKEVSMLGKVVWLNSSPRGVKGLNRKGYGIQFEQGYEELQSLIEHSEIEHTEA